MNLAAVEAKALSADALQCIVHDLASHLSAMRVQLSIWEARGVDEKGLHRFEQSIDRMERLIQSMDGASAAADHACDVGTLAAETVERHDAVAGQQGVLLTSSLPPQLHIAAAEADITRVLDNLVRNAIKFTPAGGSVTVSGGWHDKQVQIVIEDTGRGMEAHEMGRLFRPYSQLRSEDRERGTGLGLHICRELVEAHGGTISVESDGHGKGSRFIVVLPGSGVVQGR